MTEQERNIGERDSLTFSPSSWTSLARFLISGQEVFRPARDCAKRQRKRSWTRRTYKRRKEIKKKKKKKRL